MSQVINTNIASITAQRNLNESSGGLQQSIERLSSGLRINSAADDAAGLAISERFSAQIGGLEQAQRNSQDGISFAQTAEGGLEEIGNIAQRVRELAVQSANDTNSDSDREALNEEVQQLTEEANRIAETTAFNNQNVLDGSLEDLVFQVGANEGQTINVSGTDARSDQLGQTVLPGGQASFEGAVETSAITSGNTITVNGVDFEEGTDFSTLEEFASAVNEADFGTREPVTAEQASETVANLGDVVDQTDFDIGSTTVTASNASDAAGVRDEINAVSEETGVTASLNDSDQLVLEDASGSPIELSNGADTNFGNVTNGSTTLEAEVSLSVESTEDGALSVGSSETDGLKEVGLDQSQEGRTLANLSVDTRENASDAISTVDSVIDQVNSIRGELGAVQNRFESTISNLGVTTENLEAARSRIVDTDFASETAELTQNQILQQAGTSVLGQANQIPQNVVSLLQ